MHSETKVWLIAGLGLAVFLAAIVSRAFQGVDAPSAAAVLDSLEPAESVPIDQHRPKVMAQPTILQADVALVPLTEAMNLSPRPDLLASPPALPTQQAAPTKPSPQFMPLGFIRDDLPLVPPQSPVQRP